MTAIEAIGLTKVFTPRVRAGRFRRVKSEVVAVTGIDLDVVAGEIVGYLGPNGAGKSTTIKMMSGILQPSAGSIRVAGLDPMADRRALARRIGVVFGQRSHLWWDLPTADSFAMLHHVYRTDSARHRANVARFTELFELGEFLGRPVRSLSLGQRMRAELAAALLHDPEVVFLDEPTIGLDVVSKYAVREALADLHRERGVTIILTTHDLADVERLCRRLVVIDHGRKVWDGGIDELIDRHGDQRRLVVELERPQPPLDVAGTEFERADGVRQWLTFPRSRSAAEVIVAVSAAAQIRDVTLEEPDIESVIRRIYAAAPPPEVGI